MEWTTVTVIIALVGLFAALAKPLIKFNNTVTKLATTVDALDQTVRELSGSNTAAHERIWGRLDEHGETLADHDKRLTVIEHKGV